MPSSSSRALPTFCTKLPDTEMSFSVTMPPEFSMLEASARPESCIWRLTISAVSLRCEAMVPLVITIRSLTAVEACCSWLVTPADVWSRRP